MSPADTAQLLAHVQAFGSRTVGAADIAAWQSSLDPRVTLADAVSAVSAHYAKTQEWIGPSHVNSIVLKLRSDRLRLAGTAADPEPEPDETPAAYNLRLREARQAIADGAVVPIMPAARRLREARSGMRSLGGSMAEVAVQVRPDGDVA